MKFVREGVTTERDKTQRKNGGGVGGGKTVLSELSFLALWHGKVKNRVAFRKQIKGRSI